ncbi:hypothetical protein G9A89_017760 [Geosiphon pyriformis]|nr:hypothetical protein G9A89_017760 [Geosiphon pyriformis]
MRFLKREINNRQTVTTFKKKDQKPPVTFGALPQKQHSKNNFKVVTTPNTTTLEYYQSIYTHCKQKFNIPDRIEVVKKSVYQYFKNCINNYLFGNYNILEVKNNLYNNLVHYSQLETKNLNSKTLAIYFQELNFNIIEYLKQHSKITLNTPILPKTTAKHLQTSEQGTKNYQLPRNSTQQQEPISTSTNIIDYLQENESNYSENLESKETKSEQKGTTENEKEITTAYIAKIPEFTGKNNDTKSFENWQAFKDAFLQQFTDNNTSITLRNCFCNIKQETSKTVMTYLGRFNKLFRQIQQLKTNEYYSNTQILDQFIAGLNDKLIKKVCLHAPEDLATAIKHAKNYEMAMEKANHTKLVNLAIGETSLAAEEKIDQLTKKIENYFTNY